MFFSHMLKTHSFGPPPVCHPDYKSPLLLQKHTFKCAPHVRGKMLPDDIKCSIIVSKTIQPLTPRCQVRLKVFSQVSKIHI